MINLAQWIKWYTRNVVPLTSSGIRSEYEAKLTDLYATFDAATLTISRIGDVADVAVDASRAFDKSVRQLVRSKYGLANGALSRVETSLAEKRLAGGRWRVGSTLHIFDERYRSLSAARRRVRELHAIGIPARVTRWKRVRL